MTSVQRRADHQWSWLARPVIGAGLSLLFALAGPPPAEGQTMGAPVQAAVPSSDIQRATLSQRNARTPEVSTEELRRILAERSATVFDARPVMEFATGHIPGAVNVSAKPGQPMALYISDVSEIGRILSEDRAAPMVLYCNGPFCGKSSRLAEELLDAGYTSIRRYQLGAPVWRALGGVMQLEPEGFDYIRRGDRTAVLFDARSMEEVKAGTLEGAVHLAKEDVGKAKDDGRLPMEDHNTRVIVVGASPAQARGLAEEIAHNAFHNVMFCAETLCRRPATAVR
jgi:rhodanese-related sulfurtransferase